MNRLSITQYIQLTNWLKDNQGKIKDCKLSREQAAMSAMADLGFPVNAHHMAQAFKASELEEWPASTGGGRPNKTKYGDNNTRNLRKLASIVTKFYVESGGDDEEVLDTLFEIRNGKPRRSPTPIPQTVS